MTYLLDANVFIQAKNLHYGLDFCPAFWDWLVDNNAAGRVFSIDKVADEIVAGGDELTDWMQSRGAALVRPTDARVAAQFGAVSTWATSQQYEAAAINTFLQVADFYLIAHAMADGHVVVTREVPANTAKRIKIPNACIGLGSRLSTAPRSPLANPVRRATAIVAKRFTESVVDDAALAWLEALGYAAKHDPVIAAGESCCSPSRRAVPAACCRPCTRRAPPSRG